MEWMLADAKNRFSEVVTRALTEGPQRVRRRHQAVVVISETDYARLTGSDQGFADYLLNGPDFTGLDLTRSSDLMRDVSL